MYVQSLNTLIGKLLRSDKFAMTSNAWAERRSYLAWRAVQHSGHIELLALERWPRGEKHEPVVRLEVREGRLMPWMDVRYNPKRYSFSTGDHIMRVVRDVCYLTWAEQGDPTLNAGRGLTSLFFCRLRMPKYLFAGEHRSAIDNKRLLGLQLNTGETVRTAKVAKTWRGDEHTYYVDVPAPGALQYEIVDPAGWLRVDSAMTRITPLQALDLPVGRCDFKLARSNAKKKTELEVTVLNMARISGMDVTDAVRELRRNSNSGVAIANKQELQKLYDAGGEVDDLTILGPVVWASYCSSHEALTRKYGITLPDDVSRWRRGATVPQLVKVPPVRPSDMTHVCNTYSEVLAYAESFKRGA